MLDLKFIRDNPDAVREAFAKKGIPEDDRVSVASILRLDKERRRLIARSEELKALRNRASAEIGLAKGRGEDVSGKLADLRSLSDQIAAIDDQVAGLERTLQGALLSVPNLPHPSAPVGRDERDNVEVRRWAAPRQFSFQPRAHWDVGKGLGLLDFERAAKIAGARFTVFLGAGAALVRALIAFMIDLHVRQHGYKEVLPPFLVNRDCMVGTGQLPKFEEDAFKVSGWDFYLVPTAEVPVTNLHRGEILSAEDLPIKYVAYTACFRSEAGAHGRDTRGLIRQHQFDKVELVKFVLPETSYDELESLVEDAADVLRKLELPYRVVEMCTGDMGFSQSKKYDLEVWMPSYGKYVEISSCSNFEAFQARRANIRFRRQVGARPEYVHTLNGSGLAVGRTLAAILENYQEEDGSVFVPEALRPYLGGLERIEAGAPTA